jgi:hypothetical protein
MKGKYEQRPIGGQYYDGAIHYKEGSHGFVYMWINKCWTRSDKTLKQVMMLDEACPQTH